MDPLQFGATAQLGFQLALGGSPSRRIYGSFAPLEVMLLPEALRRAALRLRDVALPELARFVDDLPHWPSLPDFRACALAGHEAISGPETDGGFYRALFGQFLEAAGHQRSAHAYRELAWSWRELGTAMQLAAKDGAWDGMQEHARMLAERERELVEELLK